MDALVMYGTDFGLRARCALRVTGAFVTGYGRSGYGRGCGHGYAAPRVITSAAGRRARGLGKCGWAGRLRWLRWPRMCS
eukprot:355862-Chlamydomonas_euryale.AAC.6